MLGSRRTEVRRGRENESFPSAPRVEHGVFGGPEPQQVPHLVAKLGEVLTQVVQVLHRGLVGALHLLTRGRQVAVHQAAHDLLVVLVAFLLEVLPLLGWKVEQMKGIEMKRSHLWAAEVIFLTLRLFCLLTLPLEVWEQIHLLILVSR